MTRIFGPGWGNYAIQGIVEIEMPDPVSLAPQTPGWWCLGVLVLVLIAVRVRRRYRRWLDDRYRREAIEVLESLRRRTSAGDLEALREIAALLRAVACSAGVDREFKTLRGEAWAEVLRGMAPGSEALPIARLDHLAYAPLRQDDLREAESLIERVREWVLRHEAPGA